MTLPDNLFDPLGIVNSLKRGGEVLKEQPILFGGLHAIAMFLVGVLVHGLLGGWLETLGRPAFDWWAGSILICPAEAATIRAVLDLYSSSGTGTTTSTRAAATNAVNHTIGRIGRLLGACMLVGLAICVPTWIIGQLLGPFCATIMFVVVGCFLYVITYHTYPAIMVEHLGVTDSIGRSIELTKENRLHIFLILLIYFVCSSALLFVVGLIPVVGRIIGFLCSIFIAAFGSVLKAVVYVDIRAKQDGYTQAILTQELGSHEVSPYVNMGGGGGGDAGGGGAMV